MCRKWDIFNNHVLSDAKSKPNWRFLAKANFRDTNGSPDLVVCCFLIGLNLIYPTLAYFRIFLLDMKMIHRQFQGLLINMHDVTDICMNLQVPPKYIFNQLSQYFSSLTNDYCRHENCCSMYSNTVAMLWCLDDTHFPYMEAWNLFLVKNFHIWSTIQR